MHGRIIDSRSREIRAVCGIIAGRREIRRDVDRIRRYDYWRREVYLLPPRGGLINERGRRQRLSGAGPQIDDVRTGIVRTFVKPDTANEPVQIYAKFDAKLNAVRVVYGSSGRRC